MDEHKARLLRELEELLKKEEELKREEELGGLERQVEAARKRVRERQAESASKKARVASQGQEKLPQSSPIGNTSIAYADSGTGFHNLTSSIAQTAAGDSLGCDGQVLSHDSAVSTISSGVLPSSSRRMTKTASTNIRSIETLEYYRELNGDGVSGSVSLKYMDLSQLRRLAENEEGAEWDMEQAKSIGCVYYFIFLKTGAIEDFERGIGRANEQMPFNMDQPHYAPRLKDLIVMLIKKYQHTNSPDDLQEAIFRAQEMMAATPLDHPDRSARMCDLITMMFMKSKRMGSELDLNEAIMTAREMGAVISIDDETMKVGIPM